MTGVESEAERSCRVARIAGALGTIGLAADVLVDWRLGEPTHTQVIAMAVVATVWVWSLLRRSRPTLAFGNFAFLTINAAIIVALTASAQWLAESRMNWVPFRPHHLGALAVALLGPPLWVGVVTIVAMIGTAVVQFELFEPAIRAHLPYGDPWSTLAYGGFALALLFYRLRATRIERNALRVQLAAESYQRWARAMLAVRDLANTPLQTLTNMITLIRERGLEASETVERLERTVVRLTDLEEATRPFEQAFEWQPGDEALDAKTVLRATATAR